MTQINNQHLLLIWIKITYGWSMSKYFPYGEFKWVKNVDELDIMSINEKSDVGYILEVDLKYPDELHELHNDYPLAPEKLVVTNIVSKYYKEIADEFDIKVGDVKKLIPNLGNKTKYVLHYKKSSVVFVFRNEDHKNSKSVKI